MFKPLSERTTMGITVSASKYWTNKYCECEEKLVFVKYLLWFTNSKFVLRIAVKTVGFASACFCGGHKNNLRWKFHKLIAPLVIAP